MEKLTVKQYIEEFYKERAELIAEAKAGGYYYPELETAGEYTAASGKKCYRTIGNLDWYFLQCANMGISPRWVGDFHHEAQGDGFTLEYVEHDIILALD